MSVNVRDDWWRAAARWALVAIVILFAALFGILLLVLQSGGVPA